jgi:hypothetical protein
VSPFDRIAAHYAAEGVDFGWHYEACKKYGFVADTAAYCLMAVPVLSAGLRFKLVTPVGRDLADCWFILGLAGDMVSAWEAEPYPLPWFAFERGKKLHVWRRERIRALTSRHPVVHA